MSHTINARGIRDTMGAMYLIEFTLHINTFKYIHGSTGSIMTQLETFPGRPLTVHLSILLEFVFDPKSTFFSKSAKSFPISDSKKTQFIISSLSEINNKICKLNKKYWLIFSLNTEIFNFWAHGLESGFGCNVRVNAIGKGLLPKSRHAYLIEKIEREFFN